MPELTPAQKAQLDQNIRAMIEGGASQSDVETYAKDFRNKYDVKKKDDSVISARASVEVGNGSRNTSQSGSTSSQFGSGTNLTENLLKKIDDDLPVIKIADNKIVVTPEAVPKGYANQYVYADELNKKIAESIASHNEDAYKAAIREVNKVDALGRLSNNNFVVTSSDMDNINNLISDNRRLVYDGASPEVLEGLKIKKNQLIQAARNDFENDTDNYRIDNKTGRKIFTKEFKAPDTQQYDSLIEKVSNSLQQEVNASGKANVLSGDTESGLNVALRSGSQQISNVLGRLKEENLNNSFFTGLEALKYKDENRYNLLTKRLQDGKTLSSPVVAELTNSGASIIQARKLEQLQKDEVGIEEYREKEAQVNKDLENNFYGRPDILQKNVANIIGEYHAAKGRSTASRVMNTIFGEWQITDKEIDQVPAEYFTEKGIDVTRPEFKAAIQSIKDNEGFLPFDNAVQKDGLSRELLKGFAQPFQGTASTVGGIFKSDNEKRLESELSPIEHYTQERTNYFNKNYGMLADAVNGAGQFVGQYLLMEAGAGLLKNVGAAAGGSNVSRLVRTPEAAEGVAVREGTSIGNKIMDKSQAWAQVGVPFVQSYDQYYKQALQQTDNTLAAKVYAFVNSGMEAASEQIFDNVKFGRSVIKDFSSNQMNVGKIAKILDKGLFDEAAQKEFREVMESGLKKSMRIAGEGIQGLAKESFEEVPVAATNFLMDAMVNPQSVEGRDVFGEMKDAFLSGMVNFSIPSLIGVGGKLRSQFKNANTEEDALMVAARNRNDVLDAIYNLAEDGDLTQDQVNAKVKILNTAAAALKKVPETYGNGAPISEADRVKYLSLSVKENFLKEQDGPDTDEAVKEINKAKIQDINRQKVEILNTVPSTPESPAAAEEKPIVNESEKVIIDAANNGTLDGKDGIYSNMVKADPSTAATVLLDLAKQKYGVQEDGSDSPAGGRNLQANTSLDVDEAVTKAYPTKESLVSAIQETAKAVEVRGFNTIAESISYDINPLFERMNNADNINESELNTAADKLYDVLDRVEKSGMTPEQKQSSFNLIEPLITKLEGYEFTTKTENSTVTEKVPTGTTNKTKREIRPAFEQAAGSPATVTLPDGSIRKGTINIKSGSYVLDIPKGQQIIIGEKAITDRDLKLPPTDRMENPIQFDEDGNVKSVTFETRSGNLVTIEDPEKALDLAIQIQADIRGEIPDGAFQEIYDEVEKTIPVEVLKNTGQPATATQPAAAKEESVSVPQNKISTFENVKEGDTVEHNGQKITVVGKKKSRGGNDVIEVKTEPKTKKEIEEMVWNEIGRKHKAEFPNGITLSEAKDFYFTEFMDLTNELTSRENGSTYTIDKKTWDNEVKSKNESVSVPEEKNPFTESKVPQVVYRATTGGKYGEQRTGDKAIFFTSNRKYAEIYAEDMEGNKTGEVKAHYVDLKNPLIVSMQKDYKELANGKMIENAKKDGYDGIIAKDETGNVDEIVVFDGKQVKQIEEKGRIEKVAAPDISMDVDNIEDVNKKAKIGTPISFSAARIEKSNNQNELTGVHFGDSGIISEYKRRNDTDFYKEGGESKDRMFGGDVASYNLSFKNPLVVTSKEQFIKKLAENGDKEAISVMPNYKENDIAKLETTHKTHKEIDEFVARKAREKGYDGIITPLEYVALDKSTYKKIEPQKTTVDETKPVVEETVDGFVERIKKGEQMSSPEDLQFYENNKKEIEDKLKTTVDETKSVVEEDEPIDAGLEEEDETDGSEKFDDPTLSGIRKALVSDAIIKDVDLEKISNRDMMAKGREILNTGEVNPEALVSKILKNKAGVLTPTEVVALITYKADLDNNLQKAYKDANKAKENGEDTYQYEFSIAQLEQKIDDFDVMAVITANQQSMAFRLRQNMLDRDYNVVTQIEKYKKNNGGEIPAEVEAKFREYDKQLKKLKSEISDLEREKENREAQQSVDNIKESVDREKKFTDEELEAKVKKGVQEEISKIYEQLPANKRSAADKAIEALDNIQKKLRNKTYDAALGIPVAIINGGISTIKNAIKLGVTVQRAVEIGINKIKESLNGKKWDKEDEFRKDMIAGFESEGINTKNNKKDTFSINKDGTVDIPNQMIRDLVERGITDINDLTDAVHEQVVKQLPDIDKRQIRDFITDYGKTVNPTADDIQQQVNTAKRIGRLQSELEDLQKISNAGYVFKYKQNPSPSNKTQKEKELKSKINSLSKDLFGKKYKSEDQKLSDSKARVKARIEELNRLIKNKDFAKKEKALPPTDAELVKLNSEKEKLQEQFDNEQYKLQLKNRTGWQIAEDIALELTSGLVRGLVASIDVSAVLVQGLWRTFSNPKLSLRAMGTMFSHMVSEKRSQQYIDDLKASQIYPLLQASRVAVGQDQTGKISAKEGFFVSNWINAIWDKAIAPVIGAAISPATKLDFKKAIQIARNINPYKASQRAFDGYVNAVRVNSFVNMAKYLSDQGYTFEADPKVFQKAADFVNTTTGRGSLGQADASSRWLNIFFFAPRKVISELKLFTPYAFVYYGQMPKAIRMKNLRNFGKFAATFVLTNGLLHEFLKSLNPDDYEPDEFWNPTSTDFLTHKINGTKISIGGGMKTTLVFMQRLWKGYYTDKHHKQIEYGSGYGVDTRLDLILSFILGKASPAAQVVRDKMDEKKGREKSDEDYLKSVTVPIWMQDVGDLYRSNPTEAAAIYTLFSLLGANVKVDQKSHKK